MVVNLGFYLHIFVAKCLISFRLKRPQNGRDVHIVWNVLVPLEQFEFCPASCDFIRNIQDSVSVGTIETM